MPYLAGVSTRRVEKLVQQLGVERMSKSQVSKLAKSLDQIVEDFRTRPLDGGPYVYVTFDALVVKCREGGRTVNVCVVHAVAVNRDGVRESLGLDVVTAEDGAAWLAFLRSLVARGLGGVRLVTSDAPPDVVGSVPDRAAIVRLGGARLAEQNDEWAAARRRYMSVESIAKALAEPDPEPPQPPELPAAA